MNNTTLKEKRPEKEENDLNKSATNDKAKIMDKLKSTAKIKRPVIGIKTQHTTPKLNTTNYETNVTPSNHKSPFESNFTSDKPNTNKEKKIKESKDDSNLVKTKKTLDAHHDKESKLDKTHRIDKKTTNINDEADPKNIINTLGTKKSYNKIAVLAKKPSDKNNENESEAKNKKEEKKVNNGKEKIEKNEKLKESKITPKFDRNHGIYIFNIFYKKESNIYNYKYKNSICKIKDKIDGNSKTPEKKKPEIKKKNNQQENKKAVENKSGDKKLEDNLNVNMENNQEKKEEIPTDRIEEQVIKHI